MPGLAPGDGQPVAPPVDVVQGQRRHLAGPQPVGHQQQQDRVITLAARSAAVDGAEHQPGLLPGDGPRDAGQLVGRRPLYGLAQVGCQQALAARVAEEHAQHPADGPHRRPGQARTGALGDERAEDRRRQVLQPGDADLLQVRLEARQVMPVTHDRLRAQAALLGQVLEEPRHRAGEGQLTARPAGALEAGQDHRQHLPGRATDLGSGSPAAAPRGHPHSDEIIDVSGQVRHGRGAAPARELPERHQRLDMAPHRPGAIAPLSQPAGIALDLCADPAGPDPAGRLRLDRSRSPASGQLPLSCGVEEAAFSGQALCGRPRHRRAHHRR